MVGTLDPMARLTAVEKIAATTADQVATIAKWVAEKQKNELAEQQARDRALAWAKRAAQGIGVLVIGQAFTVWIPAAIAHWWSFSHGVQH